MKTQEFDGYWTLAGSDAQVPGRLTFSPERGVVLALNGAFDADDVFRIDDAYHTIHGVTSAGKQVTLVRCLRGKTAGGSAYTVAEYTSSIMVVGCHFPSYEKMRFKRVSVSYYNLEEIFGASGIKIEGDISPTAPITLNYKKPEPLKAVLGDFSVETQYSWKIDGDGWEERRIAQQAWLTSVSEVARHLDDFLAGPLRSLHNLVELAADVALPIEGIEGAGEVDGAEHSVEVFIRPARHVTPPKRRHPSELLFTLYGLGERFAECVQRWHAGKERYGPTFDLFFSLDPSLFLEHQFLNLIQAVEAYHRRVYPNYALPPDEHALRRVRVTEALAQANGLSDTERRWVEAKIQYNEPSLVDRLAELHEMMPTKVRDVLGSRGKFSHTIADTRHYMTHWDEQKRAGALTGADLLLGVQQLRLVIKVIFLSELALATDQVIDRLREPRIIARLR